MVVHQVCVAPDKVGARPQDNDEEAEQAGVDDLESATLTRHYC